ncbi:MAG: hypothetical protein ACRDA5_10235 [Clostridium sp.]
MDTTKSKSTLGEIISNAFSLVTHNALEILKVTGIFLVPALIGMVILMSVTLVGMIGTFIPVLNSISNNQLETGYIDTIDPELITNLLPKMVLPIILLVVISILISFVSYFAYGIIIKILGDRYCDEETGWKYSMKYVWSKKWSLIGMNLLVILILLLVYTVLALLLGLLAITTKGIGFIIIIPIVIIWALIMPVMILLFNSMLIIKDLRAIDAIGQTFGLFKFGGFWRMVGKCLALGGLSILMAIPVLLLAIIPFVGIIAIMIGQVYIQSFVMAACNIIVIDDMHSSDNNDDDYSEVNFIE